MNDEVIPCAICGNDINWHYTPEGEVFWTTGHNAQPLADGRCCDDCNGDVVAYRLALAMERRGNQ